MAKLSIEQLEVSGKPVLLRVDFNVPLMDSPDTAGGSRVSDDTRIRTALPTINYLIERRARVILCSHLGRPKGTPDPRYSLRPVAEHLALLLGQPVSFTAATVGAVAHQAVSALQDGEVLLLENLRFYSGETANDPDFARALASLADLYVSDAFGTAHRAHASTSGAVTHFSRAAHGFLIGKELEFLGMALKHPRSPYVAVVGGAKVGDKIGVLRSLLQHADTLLIGGAMAYTFLKARGYEIGLSLLDEPHLELAQQLMAEGQAEGKQLELPVDHVVGDALTAEVAAESGGGINIPVGRIGMDIGPMTVAAYQEVIAGSRMVLWNGPMGVFERAAFQAGTFGIAQAVADADAVSIVGGGDSVAAVNQAGVADRISHISTGGGATLEFLEGKALPGIDALSDA